MTTMPFVFCVIYPLVAADLDDATEVVVWPPNDDARHEADTLDSAKADLASAVALARMFVVKSPDDRAGADCIREYFAQTHVVPTSLTVLDVDLAPHWVAPLQDAPPNATCCCHLPFLFAMRNIEPDSIEKLHQFCWDIVNDGPAEGQRPAPSSNSR
jgi:hypothetical protein